MKFVALLSGGKDSCYNAMKCIQHGHSLVALANLFPSVGNLTGGRADEDADSFMYQTAAHNLLPAIAECMEVPLIRRPIMGTAVIQTLSYESISEGADTAGDEVEDLFLLLQDVKQQFPDVQGVSCGAILSTYQRLRVEHVCDRLGLTPLTYLWQRSRDDLLEEMIGSGIDAVVVKIAGGGLTPQHLGKSLSELKPMLYQLHGKYGLDICGEGGEYETIVLDCPLYTNKRIQITSSSVLNDDTNCDSVANLKILDYFLVYKQWVVDHGNAVDDCTATREREGRIQRCVTAALRTHPPSLSERRTYTNNISSSCRIKSYPKLFQSWDGVLQTQLIVPRATKGQSMGAQMNEVMTLLRDCISHNTGGSCSIEDVIYAHLYLRDMCHFAQANSEYCKYFAAHPPSRSCVAAGDGSSQQPLVAIDAVIYERSHASIASDGGRSSRRGVLHVKGFSEWAPTCIGPYSQANSIEECVVYVAGQIPLDPPTMTINSFHDTKSEAIYYQLALCLQHNSSVLGVLNSKLSKAIAVTVYVDVSSGQATSVFFAELAAACEEMIRGGLLEFPDAPADNISRAWSRGGTSYDNVSDSDSDSDSYIATKISLVPVAPIQVVGVSGLPRDAQVEVELIATTNRVCSTEGSIERRKLHVSRALPGANSHLNTAQMEQWPLWRSRIDNICEPSVVEMSLMLMCSTSQWCSGVVDAFLPSQQYYSSFLHDALFASYTEIVAAAAESKVRLSAIKYVKVYYSQGMIDGDDVAEGSRTAAMAAFGEPGTNVILVPTPTLDARQAAFSVSFLYYDLLQMKTECWIDGC